LRAVAQGLREYDQARKDYQQALQICIEFGDGHGQARVYFCIASLAEAEGNPSEARANFQQALERYIEYRDDHWADETKRRIERLSLQLT
jgi:tetratricopeptide (TPR) repeat protein